MYDELLDMTTYKMYVQRMKGESQLGAKLLNGMCDV